MCIIIIQYLEKLKVWCILMSMFVQHVIALSFSEPADSFKHTTGYVPVSCKIAFTSLSTHHIMSQAKHIGGGGGGGGIFQSP